jgi:hypothetical protein
MTKEDKKLMKLHTKKSETGGKFAKKYCFLKLASEHACIIN